MDHLTQAQEKDFKSVFGTVVCRIPSLKQRLEVSKRMQRYAEGLLLSASDWDLIEAMATLDVIVTEAPKEFERDKITGGWDYDKLYDLDALIKLSMEVKGWIESFRRPLREEQGQVG